MASRLPVVSTRVRSWIRRLVLASNAITCHTPSGGRTRDERDRSRFVDYHQGRRRHTHRGATFPGGRLRRGRRLRGQRTARRHTRREHVARTPICRRWRRSCGALIMTGHAQDATRWLCRRQGNGRSTTRTADPSPDLAGRKCPSANSPSRHSEAATGRGADAWSLSGRSASPCRSRHGQRRAAAATGRAILCGSALTAAPPPPPPPLHH